MGCFDIELTKGEADLVPAFERAFAACKQAGLLVMVTTSHSAPYAAPSVSQKLAIIDSWAKSDNIDIFSPQLYTSGVEKEPDFWGEGYAQVGIEAIKDAGFQGVCFEIELTKGEADLVGAFEKFFAE